MINGQQIKDINLSWLYHMTASMQGIDYIFQTCDLRTPGNAEQLNEKDEFVIVSPLRQWGPSDDGLGLLVAFQLAVVVRQGPGDILKAFTRIVDIQEVIEQALYGSERLLVDSMGEPEYAIPFRSFNEDGDPQRIIDSDGLRYGRGLWADITPEGELVQAWNHTISATIH